MEKRKKQPASTCILLLKYNFFAYDTPHSGNLCDIIYSYIHTHIIYLALNKYTLAFIYFQQNTYCTTWIMYSICLEQKKKGKHNSGLPWHGYTLCFTHAQTGISHKHDTRNSTYYGKRHCGYSLFCKPPQ